MAEELRGSELLKAAVNRIIDDPESWDQTTWHCGTRHCFAGHCQILGGKPASDNTNKDMQELVGLSYSCANWLSAGNRTFGEIYAFASRFIAGYDIDGYDCAGYDIDGYNCAGYDIDGYNRTGYNIAGYQRQVPINEYAKLW